MRKQYNCNLPSCVADVVTDPLGMVPKPVEVVCEPVRVNVASPGVEDGVITELGTTAVGMRAVTELIGVVTELDNNPV